MDVITHVAAGPFAAACVLLGAAGVSKVRSPSTTQGAATALALPDGRTAVRALGLCELGAAGAGIGFGGPGAAAVAVVYGALAIAAWRLYVRAPQTPCGCIGATDSPISASHIVLNIGAAIAAAFAVASGSPLAAAGHSAWRTGTFVVLAGSCAALVAVMIESLPVLRAAARESSSA